jgi:Ca2+/Na+ antiporter
MVIMAPATKSERESEREREIYIERVFVCVCVRVCLCVSGDISVFSICGFLFVCIVVLLWSVCVCYEFVLCL